MQATKVYILLGRTIKGYQNQQNQIQQNHRFGPWGHGAVDHSHHGSKAPHHSAAGHPQQDPIRLYGWSLGQRGTEGGLLGLGDLEVSQRGQTKGRRWLELPLGHLVRKLVPVHQMPLGWSHAEVVEEVLDGEEEKSEEVRIA